MAVKTRTSTWYEEVTHADPSRTARMEDVYNYATGEITKRVPFRHPNALVKDEYKYILWPDGTYMTYEGTTEAWWPYYIPDAIN